MTSAMVAPVNSRSRPAGRRRSPAGDPDAGAGARAASHLDEPFGLQHPHRLAQRRTADAEVSHQFGLVGQEVPVLELAVDHHAAQGSRDELGRLG